MAQALQTGRFTRLHLLCDSPEADAHAYIQWLASQASTPVTPHIVELTSPMDFGGIYQAAKQIVASCVAGLGSDLRLTFHLSPGTSAMAAIWIILAKTRFPAELIHSSIPNGVEIASVPFEISADFIPTLLNRPDRELERLTAGLAPEDPEFSAIIHRSAVMQQALAHAIHRASPRREHPFITVNYDAIAPDLLESELFGHEKGAFTCAHERRTGYFEAAHGGTLFLDEIGELPKPAQVRFLRALQEGEIMRVGATRAIPVDVRLIAATNRSLTEEVAQGRFRDDLFYRLAVAVILLPPLREREGDAGILLDRLLKQVNRESAGEPGFTHKYLSVGARKILLAHSWPGNVREMQNTLRRAAVWSGGETIEAEDAHESLLPASAHAVGPDPILTQNVAQGIDLPATIDRVARHYLEQVLEVSGGNKTRAAQMFIDPNLDPSAWNYKSPHRGRKKTGPNPTDRGKQGVKRRLLTEANGIPLAVVIDGANRHERKLTRATLEGIVVPRPEPTPEAPHGRCLDAGDDDDAGRKIVKEWGFTPHIRPRGEEAEAIVREPGFNARRWVVERTHRWMNRFRRLLVRWEKRDDTSLAMVHLALGIITWRANGLLG